MGDLTARLDLYLPGGGSTGLIVPDEVVDIDVINENMRKIDAAVGAKSYTSVTRPPSPFDGQVIYETDTKRIVVFRQASGNWESGGTSRGLNTMYAGATLADLDTISDAVIGDTFWMTAPGTGISPLLWRAFAGAGAGVDWRPANIVISDTRANLNTFIAAVILLPDLTFEVGSLALVTASGVTYRFITSAGFKIPTLEWVPLKPTSITGSTAVFVTLGNDGIITCASGAVGIQANGVFSDEFNEYKMVIVGDLVNTAQTTLQLAVGGVVNAVGYDYQQDFHNSAASYTAGAAVLGAIAVAVAPANGADVLDMEIKVTSPFNAARRTRFQVTYDARVALNGSSQLTGKTGGSHRSTASYDGVSFGVSGIGLTGTVQFFGRAR